MLSHMRSTLDYFRQTVAIVAVATLLTAGSVQATTKKQPVATKHPSAVKTPGHAKNSVPVRRTSAQSTVRGRQATSHTARHGAKNISRRASATSDARGRIHSRAVAEPAAARMSFGQLAGLHNAYDPLELKSSVALVVDQDTNEVLFSKNEEAVLPIASITKLMTGVVVSEARLPMEEPVTITQDDVDTEKGSRSRLQVGTTLTRGEMLHLALMSSENRAAHALGRTFPGGLATFVTLMNAKAKMLGMRDTRYVEPTGLSSRNQSSARDLATLVSIASTDPQLRELTTSPSYLVEVGDKTLQYNNTNRLVKNPLWDIGLQKTGYISEAGQCLVMQAKISGRKLIMVFLDSAGKLSRVGDAERVRRWVESIPTAHAVKNPAHG